MSTAKSYKLTKVDVILSNGENIDIREIISEYNWYESIDSAFIRCDFTILDTIQFDDQILGSEQIDITFESTMYKGSRIKNSLQIYKIGAVVKQERSKLYILAKLLSIFCIIPTYSLPPY